MKRSILAGAAGAIFSFLAITPVSASDYSQLIHSAGLSPNDSRDLTLDEIAAYKFSREGHDNRQTILRHERSAGLAGAETTQSTRTAVPPSLDEIYRRMINRSTSGDERQTPSSRQFSRSDPKARSQLAGAASLISKNIEGLSLDELALHRFNRGSSGDNRIATTD